MSIENDWCRIERWLQANAPPVLAGLRPAASSAQIAEAEARLGASFPSSVRQSFQRHDGEAETSAGLFGLWRWLPLAEVLSQTEEMRQIEEEFEFGDFEPGFMLPLLADGGGNLRYVEAAEGGAETPVIEWWHEVPSRDVRFENWAIMLAAFTARLTAGAYRPISFGNRSVGLTAGDAA